MLVQMQMWTGLGLGVFATVIGHLVAYKRRPVIVQAGAQAATQSMTTTSPPTEPPSGP